MAACIPLSADSLYSYLLHTASSGRQGSAACTACWCTAADAPLPPPVLSLPLWHSSHLPPALSRQVWKMMTWVAKGCGKWEQSVEYDPYVVAYRKTRLIAKQ